MARARARLVAGLVTLGIVTATVGAAPPALAAGGPTAPDAVSAAPALLGATLSWAASRPGGGGPVRSYIITDSEDDVRIEVPANQTRLDVPGLRPGVDHTFSVQATDVSGNRSSGAQSGAVRPTAAGGDVHQVSPVRLVDTRTGLGAPRRAVRAGAPLVVKLLGRGGLPSAGVRAVLANITVTVPSSSGRLTAAPGGAAPPRTTGLAFARHQTVAGAVLAGVGTGGGTVLRISAGTAHVVVDVTGWIATDAAAGAGGSFVSLPPARVLDTRSGLGAARSGPLAPGGAVTVPVAGAAGLPDAGVSAVVVNLTAVGPDKSGYLTAFPAGDVRPTTSTVNFAARQVVANRAVVPVGDDGITVYNAVGHTHALVDVVGYVTDDPTAPGDEVVVPAASRVLDTSAGTGGPRTPLGPRTTRQITLGNLPAPHGAGSSYPVTGVLLTVTAVSPTASGFLQVVPSGAGRPETSDVNFARGGTTSNLVLARLGTGQALTLYNSAGSTGVTVDLVGYLLGGTSVPDTTKVLPPQTAQDAQVTPDAVSLPKTDVTEGLRPGDVLNAGVTSGTPSGLLRVVESVSQQGGTVVAQTRDASLDEAVGSATFAYDEPLTVERPVSAQTADGVRMSRLDINPGKFSAEFDIGDAVKNYVHRTRPGDSASEAPLKATAEISMHPRLHLAGNLSLLHGSSSEFWLGGDLEQEIKLKGEAPLEVDLVSVHLVDLPGPTFVFPVGPLLIVVKTTIPLNATVKGKVAATVESSVTFKESFTLGVRTSNGSSKVIRSGDASFEHEVLPTLEHSGAEITGGLSVGLRVTTEGVLSGETDLHPQLVFTLQPFDDEHWWKLKFYVKGTVHGDLRVFGKNLLQYTSPELKLLEYTLAESQEPGPDAGGREPTAAPTATPTSTPAPTPTGRPVVSPRGPVVQFGDGRDLDCSLTVQPDTHPQYFGGTACGTLLAVDGTLYGPRSLPAGGGATPRYAWTPLSSTVTGNGSATAPWTVTTEVAAGDEDLRLRQVTTYVDGSDTLLTSVSVINDGDDARTVRLYRALDCYTADNDKGQATGGGPDQAVDCINDDNGTGRRRVLELSPRTRGAATMEGYYSNVWSVVGRQAAMPNTCVCDGTLHDNALGLSWDLRVPSSGQSVVAAATSVRYVPIDTLQSHGLAHETTRTGAAPSTAAQPKDARDGQALVR